MVDYGSCGSSYTSVGHQGEDYSPGIEDTLRNLRVEIISYKVENDRLVEA